MVFLPSQCAGLQHSAPDQALSSEVKVNCMEHDSHTNCSPVSVEDYQNLVIVQVNQGETFTIQNEDGTCRNIPGPAQVPMISHNGAIPPIFVPPGYISQVFEENGLRRIIVSPNSASNFIENSHADIQAPTMSNLPYHFPVFHHASFPHIQYPINNFHAHLHPPFVQQQNLTMIPNYQPDAIHFTPRQVCSTDDLSDSAYSSMRHSCMSETPPPPLPVRSPSIQQLQSYQIDQHGDSQERNMCAQSSSESPPVTSCLTSSPDSSSSYSPSPPASPQESHHLPITNGHKLIHASANLNEVIYDKSCAKSKQLYDVVEDSLINISTPSSEDEVRIVGDTDINRNGNCTAESKSLETLAELFTTLKKPEIRELRPRSTRVVWSSLAISSASASLQQRLARSKITYDLHLACRKRETTKFSSIYSGTEHQFLITDLRPATDYSLRLFAICNREKSSTTGITSFHTPSSSPDTPSPPNLLLKPKNYLFLRWKAPHDNGEKISKYHIEISEGQHADDLHSSRTSTSKQIFVQKLVSSKFYAFRLCAENKIGKSPWSVKVNYSTLRSAPPIPSPPRIIKFIGKNLTLAWQRQSATTSGFKLEMSTESTTYGYRPVYNGPDEQCTVKIPNRNSLYKFRLQAYNGDARSPYSETVYFNDKPIAPPKPQLKGTIRSRYCEISWENSRCNTGLEVSKYVIGMSSDKGLSRQVYSGTGFDCTVDNLEPGHTYRFRLVHFFIGGNSSPPSDALVVTTPPDIPGVCLPPVLAFRPAPTSLTISWVPPTEACSAIASGYEVNCIASFDICKKEPFQAYKGSNTECTIENLLPNTRYSLALRAVNNVGVGPWSENLEVVTSADVPSKPDIPVATVFGPSTVHLQWTPPQNNGAEILNYKLHWGCTESEMCPVMKGSVLVHEFQSLSPNTKYCYSLQAINSVGAGPASKVGSFLTSSGTPDSVSALRLQRNDDSDTALVTANQISVCWDEPCGNGSKVLGYKIHSSIESASKDTAMHTNSSIPVDANVTSYCLKNLIPDTCYRIKVCAFNAIGCGCFGPSEIFRTKPLPPPAPIITCKPLSYSTLLLEWGDRSRNDLDTQYLLQMKDRNGRFNTIYKGDFLSKKLSKLNENTTYSFRISVANNSEGVGLSRFSKVQSFTTPFHLPTVESPVVQNITPTSCDVRWSYCNRIKRDLIDYHIYIKQSQDETSEESFICNENHFTLLNLSPRTDYSLSIRAVRHRVKTHSSSSHAQDGSLRFQKDSISNSDKYQHLSGPLTPAVTFRTADVNIKTVDDLSSSCLLLPATEVDHASAKTTLCDLAGFTSSKKTHEPVSPLSTCNDQIFALKILLLFFSAALLSSYVLYICIS